MTKIEWNRPGGRLFESGLDHAVLFIDDAVGIPWNGLVSLKNKSTGGDTRDVYIDGVKANSESTIEEYLGTLEAVFYPPEFEACDGIGYDPDVLIRLGQQPRKPFHLAFRTWEGSDTLGAQAEYKIHLIYNAYILPSKRKFRTLASDVELQTFSWDVSSTPIEVPGFLPTSHLIFESKKLYPKILLDLENIVFGSYFNDSRMPSPSEVIDMVGSYLPVRMIQNKLAFEVENLSPNPVLATNNVGWYSSSIGARRAVSLEQYPGVSYYFGSLLTGSSVANTRPNVGLVSGLIPGETYSATMLVIGKDSLWDFGVWDGHVSAPGAPTITSKPLSQSENWHEEQVTFVAVSSEASVGIYAHAGGTDIYGTTALMVTRGATPVSYFDAPIEPGLHSHVVLGLRDPDLEGDLVGFEQGLYYRPTSTRLFETAGPGLFTLEEG